MSHNVYNNDYNADDDDDGSQIRPSKVILEDDDEVQDWKLLGQPQNRGPQASICKSSSITTTKTTITNATAAAAAIATATAAAPLASSSIPRRGEKEFEPDGTHVQISSLEESQNAMFNALLNTRGHHLRQKLIGVWSMRLQECLIFNIRGKFFQDMGAAKGSVVYLNAVETVYLCERGSLVVYLSNDEFDLWLTGSMEPEDFDVETKLMALDLEFLYCLTKINLSKYLVYSHLKRLGYIVLEHHYEIKSASEFDIKEETELEDVSFWKLPRKWGVLSYPALHNRHMSTANYFKYTPIFKAIAIQHLKIAESKNSLQHSKLQLTYNVWKPTPSFSKKNPPKPDFQLVVVDAEKTPMYLSYAQINNLQQQLAQIEVLDKLQTNNNPKPSVKKKEPRVESKKQIQAKRNAERQSKLDISIQERNTYLRKRDESWKNGFDKVIAAVVNQGLISFVQLSSGNFRCLESDAKKVLDLIYPERDHSLVYNEI